MIEVRNKIAPKETTSLSFRPLSNDRSRTFTNNALKPKPKGEGVIGPCYKCNGTRHIARDCPAKIERKSQKLELLFSSQEEDYKVGEDEDVSYTERANSMCGQIIDK